MAQRYIPLVGLSSGRSSKLGANHTLWANGTPPYGGPLQLRPTWASTASTSDLVPGDTNGAIDVFVYDCDDEDGVDWAVDNCPTVPNPDQADFNSDGTGDVCEDSDHDGCLDAEEMVSAPAEARLHRRL